MAKQYSVGRPLRAGIVGGGEGAFIGRVHRMAAELDGAARVIAGVLSSNPERNRSSAAAWFLERSYDSYAEMARQERLHEAGIDFVIIATPNHLHFEVAKACLEAGIHVVCDKPMTLDLREAEQLAAIAAERGLILAVTHTYTGYPAIIEARERVSSGMLGDVRKILVEYLQDWLMMPIEQAGQKQAAWRTDPKRAGNSGCVADIGTHGEHLLEFITGLRIRALCADFKSFVPGRELEDDANILLRLDNGATGVLTCSQIACGEANNLRIRVYGTLAGLEWSHLDPGVLLFKPAGQPQQRLEAGTGYLSDAARAATRLPAGHPEGYIEAFANLYRNVIADIHRSRQGQRLLGGYPTAREGVRGVQFVAKAVASARLGAAWVEL